jgi:DNA-binding NarL/FixJ family response regulator
MSVVVIHPERLAAEGIATALGRYPGLFAIGHATSATEGLRLATRADAAVIHDRMVGARVCIRRLHAIGVRVTVIGDTSSDGRRSMVSTQASLQELAGSLVPDAGSPDSVIDRLTPREREILSLAAKGLAGKQIARILGIRPKTVERHKTRTYSKLGVPNQAAAVGLLAREASDDGELRWNLSST